MSDALEITTDWQPINTAPVGPTIIVANEVTGDVFPAYGTWRGEIPFPFWVSIDPEGQGYCKPTHWQPLPTFKAEVR